MGFTSHGSHLPNTCLHSIAADENWHMITSLSGGTYLRCIVFWIYNIKKSKKSVERR